MHKGMWLIALALLFILPSVSAYDTPINIHTYKDTFVMVRVFPAGEPLNLINSFLDTSVDADGRVSFTGVSNSSKIDIAVYIKLIKNGRAEIYKRFENITAGEAFSADVFKDGEVIDSASTAAAATDTNQTNETVAATESNETITQASNETNSITGNAVVGLGTGAIKSYYLWIGILAAGLIAGGVMFTRARQRKRNGLDYKPAPVESASETKTISPEQQLSSDTLDSLREELQATKAKLQQANSQISKIQNKERVSTLEQHIKEEEAAM